MPVKTFQIPAPVGAPPWFAAWQVQLGKVLADISQALGAAQGQDGHQATFSGILDAGGNRIINVGTPKEVTDAATKKQIDDIVTLLGSLPALRAGNGITIGRPATGEIVISLR